MKYDKSYNVNWDVMIAVEKIGEEAYDIRPWPEEIAQDLLKTLGETATEFLRYRDQIGLRNVLYDHGRWMRGKSWFNENVERFGSSNDVRGEISQ